MLAADCAQHARLRGLEMISAFGMSQALRVAAQLGLAEHMMDSPKTSDELAALTASDPSALHRLLCALANMGIVDPDGPRNFTLTPLGRDCFASGTDDSLGAVVQYLGHPACWTSWGELLYSVKTGRPAFPHVYGMSAWTYRAQTPELNTVFNLAVRALSEGQKNALVSHYDFSATRIVVDVGGGNGTLLAEVLQKHPTMRGVLFDQPHVVAEADELLKRAGVEDRCEIIGGDFFAGVPKGGDLYLMRAVVHNWDDEAAESILRNCRQAMRPGSKLLLVEGLLKSGGERNARFWPSFLDLHMLVTLGGRQRTLDELTTLCASTGFRLSNVVDLPESYTLIEGELI